MSTGTIKFTESHNWINLKRKFVTIGATDFLLNEMGNLISLSLPKVGDEIVSGIAYGEIESMNDLRDLVVPIDGEVIKTNTDLYTSLKKLQKDPYEGWFAKVRILEPEKLDQLMDEHEYNTYTKSLKKKRKK
jgi:glycine cleavage system H protein